MVSRLPIALLALGGLFPVTAAARTEIRMASGASMALAEPRAGAVLAAGAAARLAWEPLDAFAELGEVDEWEAFLSVDGGATYPLRITPQLDLDLRGVLWRVPDLESDDARILFHFGGRDAGGERFEVAVELARRFRIAAARSPVAAPLLWTFDRGQVALPGEPGVVGWVEGSRRGEGLRAVATIDPHARLTGYELVDFRDSMPWVETDPQTPGSFGVAPAGYGPPEPRPVRADGRRPRPPASREILLLATRLNE